MNGPPRRAGQLVEVDPVERRKQEQLLHSGVEARESRRECLLESAGEREWVGPRRLHPERGRSDRKLDQGEGVALRLFEDPAPDICRERRRAKVEERVRGPWVESGNGQLGQAGVVERARHSFPDGEEQERRIRLDSPGHELEHLGGRPVQPVCVLDDEEERGLRRPFCDQPQSR